MPHNQATDRSLTPQQRLNVILVEPEIAGNTGAVGRSCVAAGVALWLVRPLGFHINDRNIKRAGLDYWPHLTWQTVDRIEEVYEALGHRRIWLFSTKAQRSYTQVSYQPGDALVFGPESRGLPASWLLDHSDRAVCIPIRPEARSLNLSNAVSVGIFEATRQLESRLE